MRCLLGGTRCAEYKERWKKSVSAYQNYDMECPLCHESPSARVDHYLIELFGHCWSCGWDMVLKKEISRKTFEEREDKALEKKYESPTG